MNKLIMVVAGLVTCGFFSSASAEGGIDNMIGTWSWEDFTIEVTKCKATDICAKVIAGPKNVGLQMIKSKLQPMDGSHVGQIAHPQTGATYNTKVTMADANTWHLDGCTTANVCASGDFKRVK